ncbi:MAG TPA: PAS domain S-box protein [Methanoregulaceae archaeon]|nr:PAS domain S-box protein [Methanoregulaceae archaeon]
MASPFRVLLVDDEPDLLAIGKLFLERAGPFVIETCGSAGAALDLLAREPFDAIVSDYQMPEMDGIELLAFVRKGHGNLPFVLFTGRGREEVAIQAIDEGADFYVQKGGDPEAQFAELAYKTRVAIERRATERVLEERGRRFRALIQNSSDIIRIIDRDGQIAYDSDSGARILGYPPGSVLGHSPLEFVHPDDRTLVGDALAAVYAGTSPGTPTGFRLRHADGRWIAVESVAVNLIGTPGVDGVVTTTWPVEARRRAEEALLLSERRFRRAEEIAGVGHWELHLETGTVHASRGAQALYGIHGDEHPLADIQGVPLPEFRLMLDQAMQDLVEQGRPYEVEFTIRRVDDGRRRQVRSVATYDPDRQTVFGILHDVTDLRETEAALRRANRTLTLLTGITRHDIDNQLAVLRGYLSLAQVEESPPAVAAFLERSMAAAERIAALIRFTGTWEGIGSRPPAWLDARDMVEEAAQVAAASAVHVTNDLPAGLRVWGGALSMRVLAGLIENALRHGVSVTTVRFSAEETGEGDLVIVCEDDGVGVPADEKEQIFGRGYGSNTGLGLFLAREALGLTDIAITETGTPGEGARFELTVPPGRWRRENGNGSP